MSAPRKTVGVDQLTEWVNLALANTERRLPEQVTPEQAFRMGVASLLSQVLHATGSYVGFNYLDSEMDEAKGGTVLREGYDDTRRFYYKIGGGR